MISHIDYIIYWRKALLNISTMVSACYSMSQLLWVVQYYSLNTRLLIKLGKVCVLETRYILIYQWWDRLSSISIFMRFDFNFGCILIGLHYEEYFMLSFVLEDLGRNPAFGHGLRKRAFTFLSWAANFSELCVQVSGSRL